MMVVLRCMMAEAASVEMGNQTRPNVADADLLSSISNPVQYKKYNSHTSEVHAVRFPGKLDLSL
jgi:hypothetical protein